MKGYDFGGTTDPHWIHVICIPIRAKEAPHILTMKFLFALLVEKRKYKKKYPFEVKSVVPSCCQW